MPILTLQTDTTAAVHAVEGFGSLAHDLLRDRVIGPLTERLEGMVLASEPFRTGRLRATTVEKVYSDNPERVAGYVRITADFGKAGALEYGSHRTVTVTARHRALATLTSLSRARAEAGTYTRRTDITAHRFLRNPIEVIAPEALSQIARVLEEAGGT